MQTSWLRALALFLPLLIGWLHATGAVRIGLLDRLDDIHYDARLRWTLPGTLDDRIVIVDIDERSLAEVGRWPWGRHQLAKMTHELLGRQRASVLAFDIVFPEADTSSGFQVLQQLRKGALADQAGFAQQVEALRGTLDYDQLFAESMAGKPVVLGYYFTSDRGGLKNGKLPPPVMTRDQLQGRPIRFTEWDGYGANYEVLTEAAANLGHMNPFTDADGVIRSVPLLAEHEGQLYESLALAVFRMQMGMPRVEPGFPPESFLPRRYPALQSVKLTKGGTAWEIPVDNKGASLVPYRGKPGPNGGSFRYVSASDLIAGKLAERSLEGRIVIVGTSAPGLHDLRVTPISAVFPGVEVHAGLLSGMLDGTVPVKPDYTAGYELILLTLITVCLAFALLKLKVLHSLVFSGLLLAALVGLNWLWYLQAGLVFPLASGVLLLVLTYLSFISLGYFVENRSKRQLTQLFGTYVPPELVDEMARDPERYSLQAQNKELTVMFCDMRNFTQFSEAMPPEELRALINEVFNAVTAVISRHRGTLDKYIGDAVMAFWGAPVDAANHAELCVRAALELNSALVAINNHNRSSGKPTISLACGVNSGTMCVGDMGSKVRKAYTVVGDAVNLASRLEGLTRYYGVNIVCGEETRKLAPAFAWRELDRVRVKGKATSVTIYEPLGEAVEEAQKLELRFWNDMLRAYRSREWEAAELALFNLQRTSINTVLLELYVKRVAAFKCNPPPEHWDGSITFDQK